MAINDRVVVGDGYSWKDDGQVIMTYLPSVDETGTVMTTPDGSVVITNAGGVKVGSTGVIRGTPINVHRSYLHNPENFPASFGGKDFVQLIPVFLDRYQRVGFFPVDNLRIFSS